MGKTQPILHWSFGEQRKVTDVGRRGLKWRTNCGRWLPIGRMAPSLKRVSCKMCSAHMKRLAKETVMEKEKPKAKPRKERHHRPGASEQAIVEAVLSAPSIDVAYRLLKEWQASRPVAK